MQWKWMYNAPGTPDFTLQMTAASKLCNTAFSLLLRLWLRNAVACHPRYNPPSLRHCVSHRMREILLLCYCMYRLLRFGACWTNFLGKCRRVAPKYDFNLLDHNIFSSYSHLHWVKSGVYCVRKNNCNWALNAILIKPMFLHLLYIAFTFQRVCSSSEKLQDCNFYSSHLFLYRPFHIYLSHIYFYLYSTWVPIGIGCMSTHVERVSYMCNLSCKQMFTSCITYVCWLCHHPDFTNICRTYVGQMSDKCRTNVKHMFDICPTYVQHMLTYLQYW